MRLPWWRPKRASTLESLEAYALRYPMTGHFKFFTGPHGALGRASVLVKLTTAGGQVGWGQSVPIARWSYETLETVERVIRDYFGPALLGCEATDLKEAHRRMTAAVADGFSTGMPIARAGIDLALHDLLGRLQNRSVAELWGRKADRPLDLSWTVNPKRLEDTEALVQAGFERGYRHFNIKVAPNPEFDLELAKEVRRLAPKAFLWADANGGYEPETAFAIAPPLAQAGVDVFEAPMKPNRIAGYQALRKQGALPILMDEGIVSPIELAEFIRLNMLDGVAMKPARCGGLLSARRQIELLEHHQLMWLGSGLTDPDFSLAATLLLYGAYGLQKPAALNGPQFLTESLLTKPFEVQDGRLQPPTGPGLGVEIDPQKLAERVAASRKANAKTSLPGPPLRWDIQAGASLALTRGKQILWRFQYHPDQSHVYFHPLSLPGTAALTADAPADHVHHHGLWFCWKYLNGVNYWEHAPGKGHPAGRTLWQPPEIQIQEQGSAQITLKLQYQNPDGEIVLREDRSLVLSAPAADGSYHLDWDSQFTVEAESLHFDRTPLPTEKGGKAWGGYAGLSLRLGQWQERHAVDLQGPVEFNAVDRYRGRSPAFAYQGSLNGRRLGVAVLDHPENLHAPSPWYAIRSGNMSFFTPAVICYQPVEFARHQSFRLRYRVLVHPHWWDADRLALELRQR